MKKWFLRLAPLVLALVMVCGSCLTAFADSLDFPIGDYWVILSCEDGSTIRASSDEPLVVRKSTSYPDGVPIEYLWQPTGQVHGWIDGEHEYSSNTGAIAYFYIEDGSKVVSSMVASSHDLYYEDGTLFFPKTLQPILAPVAEDAGMERVLEQLMTILPIGLVCLVGWIALRKALRILPQILHRA